jgi:hypothetical protein
MGIRATQVTVYRLMAQRAQKRPSSGRFSFIVAGMFGLTALLTVGWLGMNLLEPGKQTTVDRSGPAVLQAIEDLSTYKASTGNFQVIVDLEKDVKMVPSFIAGQRTLMVANGSVDGEVDLSHLGPEAVKISDDRRSVDITLPAAQLSATHLDNSQTYVAERQRGLVDRIGQALSSNPGDDRALLQAADAKLLEAAHNTELLRRAEDNTRVMLTQLMTSLGFEQVSVHFENPAQP